MICCWFGRVRLFEMLRWCAENGVVVAMTYTGMLYAEGGVTRENMQRIQQAGFVCKPI